MTGLLSWVTPPPRVAVPTTTVLYGDLRTGRIIDTLDVTGCSWAQVLNDAGAVDSVTVEEHEVRAKQLRQTAPAAKTFLAVDVGGEIQEAGPIWSRVWDDQSEQLTLGAAGLWSLFDHRKVLPVLGPTDRVNDVTTVISGTDLAGIGRALVDQALRHVGGSVPIRANPAAVGVRTETFPGWQLLWVGEQLRQLTTHENGPDIRFRPRYTADKMSVEWEYEAGTEDSPLLTQVGDDWYFDRTVPNSPVVNVNTDEDATAMAQRAFVTGEGSEAGTLIAYSSDTTQTTAGWPLLEVMESHSSVSDPDTLIGQAINLRERSARPIERWTVTVRAEAARGVWAGDYARVINRAGHAWLPDGEAFMRVEKKTGDLGGDVKLEMYQVQAF